MTRDDRRVASGRAGRRWFAPPRRQPPQAGPADGGFRRRHAGTVPWHPDPQRAGTDRATHGYRQGDGLAVDADRNPFQAGGNHDGPRGQYAQAGGVPAAEQADRLPHAVHRHGDHAEDTAIQPCATAQARDVSRPVGVAGHQ